jgi:uncharacterized membrane protein YqjE
MHPLLQLSATKPQLLFDHVEAYGDLVTSEARYISAVWKRRVLLMAIALCSVRVGAVLAGVALMLWAVTPASQIQASWALVTAPSLPLALAAACIIYSRSHDEDNAFDTIREQVNADLTMLREVNL